MLDIMAKPIMAKPTMDSCTTPLPFLTSHYGTSSPYMIHPMPTVKNTCSTTATRPKANTFKVSMPEQIMNSYNTMNPTKCSQTIERLNCSTILKPKPTPNLRTSPLFRKPLPPRTSPTRGTLGTPRITAPSRTSSSP